MPITYLARTMVRTDNYQMNFTAQYQRDFGQHHLGGLFSIEKSEAESEYPFDIRQSELMKCFLRVSIS